MHINRVFIRPLVALLFIAMICTAIGITTEYTFAATKCAVTIKTDKKATISVNSKADASGTVVKNTKKKKSSTTKGTYDLAEGVYSYKVKAKGYYTESYVFRVTAEDLTNESKTINVTMSKLGGKNYEPTSTVYLWNDEIEALLTTEDLPNYERIETPSMAEGLAKHQFASNTARLNYINNLAAGNDNFHVFTDGLVPVVLLTKEDISSASSLEDALNILAASDKVNMLYQAQIHGSEPAASEGAVYTLTKFAGEEGQALTENMNLCVIPCVNLYGAQKFSRLNKSGDDPNRDAFTFKYAETRFIEGIIRTLNPEVFADCHECTTKIDSVDTSANIIKNLDDIEFGDNQNANQDDSVHELVVALRDSLFNDCFSEGLRPFEYTNNSEETPQQNNAKLTMYAGMMNAMAFTIETPGIKSGKSHLERRVYSQYFSMSSACRFISENASVIKKTVALARENGINANHHYSDDNTFTYKHVRNQGDIAYERSSYNFDGTIHETSLQHLYGAIKTKERNRPTAYIIATPKKASTIKNAIKTLDRAGITYFQIPKGTKLDVNKYGGKIANATVSDEATYKFTYGGYVIPMNQPSYNIISTIMEPDYGDNYGYKISLAQRKYLTLAQIKRFTKDNPSEGIGEFDLSEYFVQ